MKGGLSKDQVRRLLSGIYDQANNMSPVREKSYEAGQRQGLLDVAVRIARIVRENAKRPARGDR